MENILRYFAQVRAESADAFAARHPYAFLLKHPSAVDGRDRVVEPVVNPDDDQTASTGAIASLKGSTSLSEEQFQREWLVVPLVLRRRASSPPKVTYLKNTGLMVSGAAASSPPLVAGRLASADVVLPFASVSKTHAHLFVARDHSVDVVDQSSTNGTYLNGQRLASGVKTRAHCHDEVRFGRLALELLDARSFHALLRANAEP